MTRRRDKSVFDLDTCATPRRYDPFDELWTGRLNADKQKSDIAQLQLLDTKRYWRINKQDPLCGQDPIKDRASLLNSNPAGDAVDILLAEARSLVTP